jgi:hypothetical protein
VFVAGNEVKTSNDGCKEDPFFHEKSAIGY